MDYYESTVLPEGFAEGSGAVLAGLGIFLAIIGVIVVAWAIFYLIGMVKLYKKRGWFFYLHLPGGLAYTQRTIASFLCFFFHSSHQPDSLFSFSHERRYHRGFLPIGAQQTQSFRPSSGSSQISRTAD